MLILILVESNPSKGFTKFENLNLNFQRFFRYITAFSNFQILKIIFLNAEFRNGPTRYLGYARDLRRSHKKQLAVSAAPPCTCLPCFLFAYVPEIWASVACWSYLERTPPIFVPESLGQNRARNRMRLFLRSRANYFACQRRFVVCVPFKNLREN